MKNKNNLMKFAGIFAEDKNEWEKIKNKIYEDREKFKLRDFKLDLSIPE
jgi:hypothetical protein